MVILHHFWSKLCINFFLFSSVNSRLFLAMMKSTVINILAELGILYCIICREWVYFFRWLWVGLSKNGYYWTVTFRCDADSYGISRSLYFPLFCLFNDTFRGLDLEFWEKDNRIHRYKSWFLEQVPWSYQIVCFFKGAKLRFLWKWFINRNLISTYILNLNYLSIFILISWVPNQQHRWKESPLKYQNHTDLQMKKHLIDSVFRDSLGDVFLWLRDDICLVYSDGNEMKVGLITKIQRLILDICSWYFESNIFTYFNILMEFYP